MDPERAPSADAPTLKLPPDLPDDVYAAIVELTDLRAAGKSLAELPPDVRRRLDRALGRDDVALILGVNDAELIVPTSADR